MSQVLISKTIEDATTGEEITYTYGSEREDALSALNDVRIYASMVEYGLLADKWKPKEMAFRREQLYQFIQPQTLAQIEAMYEDAVVTAYENAMAYVQSYFGNMFNVTAMLESDDSSSTALTLRLALCVSTVTFLLASSPQYSEVIDQQSKQLHYLLRGLKSGQRNFGKAAIPGEPNVRAGVVDLVKTGHKP